MKEWIGVGPSAASQYKRVRYSNVADLDSWLSQLHAEAKDSSEVQVLTDADLLEDSLIFGLRMNGGVVLPALSDRFGADAVRPFVPVLKTLVGDGLATISDREVVQLTNRGRLLADAVGEALLFAATP